MISISIVSHGQFQLVKNLLDDLEKYNKDDIEILLTINIPEELPQNFLNYHFPVKSIINSIPMGFGANHNAAFQEAQYSYFCVLNPDIRLINNPFPALVRDLNDMRIGVVAPLMVDEKEKLQDNARKFLNFTGLFKRILSISSYSNNSSYPDWVAGMFMLFRKEVFEEIKGFDEKYFMYCEDMDICARLRNKKYEIYYEPAVKIIHSAQRQSHKNMRYFIWHVQSLLRFLYRYYFMY